MIIHLWFANEPSKMYECTKAKELTINHQSDGMLVTFQVEPGYEQTQGLSDLNFSTTPFRKAFDGIDKIVTH